MSAILSNAMDNTFFVECFDMAILVGIMLLGWYTCSCLLRFVAERNWQRHLRAKAAAADANLSEICTPTLTSCPDSIGSLYPRDLDDAQSVRWLLESHGVFGASPGAWVSAAGSELDTAMQTSVDEDGEYEGAESDVDWEPTQDSDSAFQAVADTKSKLGMLFEHYALFQSEPGTWTLCPAQREDSNEASDESMKDRADMASEFSVVADGEYEVSENDFDWEASQDSTNSKLGMLFEHYALFQSEPGSWTMCPAQREDSNKAGEESMKDNNDMASESESSVVADGEYEVANSDVDWEASQDSTNCKLGMLFEHYALFQSEPGTWCPAQGEGSDDASEDSMEDVADGCGSLEGLADPPLNDPARLLFEQYSLFEAEPGTWSKDSDCSTNYSSENESAEAAEDGISCVNSVAEMDSDHLEDLVAQ